MALAADQSDADPNLLARIALCGLPATRHPRVPGEQPGSTKALTEIMVPTTHPIGHLRDTPTQPAIERE